MIVGGRSNPYDVNLPWMGNVPTVSADPTTYLVKDAGNHNSAPTGNSPTDVAVSEHPDKVTQKGGGGSFDWNVGGVKGREWVKWLDSFGISFQNEKWLKNISELTYWLTGVTPGMSLGQVALSALGKATKYGLATSIFTKKGGKSVVALTRAVYEAIKALLPSHKVPESNRIDKEGIFLGYDQDGHEMWLVP